MIRAVQVDRGFPGQEIFEGVDWFLGDQDRVGLVGPNGSGKTTWLRLLIGQEKPDRGRIEAPKNQRVGYLPQFGFIPGKGTVRAEARAAFGSVLELQAERARLETRLSVSDLPPEEAESLLSSYGQVEERFRHLGGYEVDREVDRVLRGLGFSLADFDRPVDSLSGGWQMRVALARLLLERPEVLLLDEPTNHLDLEAREWLEGFLADYPGSFVLVSHDRYFLDVTVQRITDIMSRKLVDYTGNYERFLEQREARYTDALKAWERQQEEIERVQRFIDRFRYKNTKASQVQSRIKMLEKLPRLPRPVAPPRTVRFRFPQPERTGRIVVELEGVRKAYGQVQVFDGIDLQLERGQKVALVGPNGAGKSTLMRILAGQESFEGARTEGLRVSVDHFAQDEADRLPGDRTLLAEALGRSPVAFVPQIRGLLGAFLFTGDDVEKKIGVLSGGERSRLALAFMLIRPANVLLLDEPTNHLDLAAKDVLLEALRNFEGTVVFVSHDRYFLSGLANRVIEVGGGNLVDYPGDYEGFLHRKAQESLAAERRVAITGEMSESQKWALGESGAPRDKQSLAGDGASPEERGSERRRTKTPRQMRELEAKIAGLEERKQKLEGVLAREDFYRDAEKSSFYLNEYQELVHELEAAMEDWALAADALGEA